MRDAHGELPFLPERKNKIPKHHNKKEYNDFKCKEYEDVVENVLLMRIKRYIKPLTPPVNLKTS